MKCVVSTTAWKCFWLAMKMYTIWALSDGFPTNATERNYFDSNNLKFCQDFWFWCNMETFKGRKKKV